MVSLFRTGGLKPGAGPTREDREKGSTTSLPGRAAGWRTGRAVVTGDRDPGYGSTSKMIAESALCPVRDVQARAAPDAGRADGSAVAQASEGAPGLTFSAR